MNNGVGSLLLCHLVAVPLFGDVSGHVSCPLLSCAHAPRALPTNSAGATAPLAPLPCPPWRPAARGGRTQGPRPYQSACGPQLFLGICHGVSLRRGPWLEGKCLGEGPARPRARREACSSACKVDFPAASSGSFLTFPDFSCLLARVGAARLDFPTVVFNSRSAACRGLTVMCSRPCPSPLWSLGP